MMSKSMGHLIFAFSVLYLGAAAAEVWYVNINSKSGLPDGRSWETAYPDPTSALVAIAEASGPQEMWIAKGTYSENREPLFLGYFPMADDLAIYGGFEGIEKSREERQPRSNVTIIDGSQAKNGSPADAVCFVTEHTNCVIDGLGIRGGSTYGLFLRGCDGVIVNDCVFDGSEQISVYAQECTNIRVTNSILLNPHMSAGRSGIIFYKDEGGSQLSRLMIDGCKNSITGHGGAIAIESSSLIDVSECVLINNTASLGGAIYSANSAVNIDRCKLQGNSATAGGAIYTFEDIERVGSVTDGPFDRAINVRNSLITGSVGVAVLDSGGICSGSTEGEGPTAVPCGGIISLQNCSVVKNCDGAVSSGPNGITIVNSILWGNGVNEVSGGSAVAPVVFHSVIQGGFAGENLAAEPLFSNFEAGDFHLLPGSPGLGYGVDLRTNPCDEILDLDSHVRGFPYGAPLGYSSFDVGAYEFATRLSPWTLSADIDKDNFLSLSELLRVIQLYNTHDGFHCETGTEDGFGVGSGRTDCCPHNSDYAPRDWRFSIGEVLRAIQFYNSPLGYRQCADGEDGFCPAF